MTRRRTARAGIAVGAVLLVAACTGQRSTGSETSSAPGPGATATSAGAVGGMSSLVAAARKEGTLNVIALPADWVGFGAIISGFTAKYGIAVTSADPNGSSLDEVNAIRSQAGTDGAPDVVDVGTAVALANSALFAPYQVSTWADIPTGQKEPTGLWYQDYGGYMSIGYDSGRVPTITSVQDLLRPAFKGKVALNGDPAKADAALNGVMMTSLANGGSLDDISKGVDFLHRLSQVGTFIPVQATRATVANGTTPVVLDWDYLSVAHRTDVPSWKVFVPDNAVLGGYYAQAINARAPHPAAARLWEEYLYSDEGQNLLLTGGAHPVRQAAMTRDGSIAATAAAALPLVTGTPVFLSPAQATVASQYLAKHWSAAIS